MKLVHKDMEKDNAGRVTLIPEEAEDMWHIYNLLQVGDSLTASTIRKVRIESSTGSTVGSSRVGTTLTVCVKTTDFDSRASQLRVKGTTLEENQYVKLGAYHTIELELNRKFTLAKRAWDSVVLHRIEQACDATRKADVAAVVMQEGLANLLLVTPTKTLLRAKVEVTIPRKKKGGCTHEQALERFYEAVTRAVLRHIDFDVVKCILVASPGVVKDHFIDYLFREAVRRDNKRLLKHRAKFMAVHSSSGHKNSLKDILSDPTVTRRLSDTKAAGEVKAMEDFHRMLQNKPDRASYGVAHVEKAAEALAIDTLLISDELFRHQDVATRSRYVRLVDSVKDNAGNVKIFSSLHVSGERLTQMSGVAALLRFPIADLSEEDDNSTVLQTTR